MIKIAEDMKDREAPRVTDYLNKNRALEIIAHFSQATVLVLGDMMLDHFIWGKVTRISPEAPVPVVDVRAESILLGGCTNVLNNIHAIGGRVLGTGVVGADAMGERLRQEFIDRRVDTGGVVVEKDRTTTLKTRIVAHGQQIVRFDRESKTPVAHGSIERIIAYVESRLDQIGAIVVSDYNKGLITQELLDGIRRIVAGRKVVVCVDPKRDDFSFYRGFDVITPNHHEAGRALGREISNTEDLLQTGATLIEQFDFKAVLITRGEEGLSLFEKGSPLVHTPFPTVAREVFDVTGAGDTVIGVFALAMAAGASFKEAAVLANHAAGIVVGKVGTATVSREELAESL